MIKQDLNITIDSYTLNGVINVPSAVMTSTPQEEELNLAYSPNFDILAYDMNGLIEGNDKREVSFTLGDYDYTAYVKPAQKFQTGYVLLNYVDSMTQAVHSEPEPEIHTLELNQTDLYTSRDNYTNEAVDSDRLYAYFDNEVLEGRLLEGGNISYANRATLAGGWIKYTAKENIEVGEYTETAEFTYNGLTASCNVHTTITDSTPEPVQPTAVTLKWGPASGAQCGTNDYATTDPYEPVMGLGLIFVDGEGNNVTSAVFSDGIEVRGTDGGADSTLRTSYVAFIDPNDGTTRLDEGDIDIFPDSKWPLDENSSINITVTLTGGNYEFDGSSATGLTITGNQW